MQIICDDLSTLQDSDKCQIVGRRPLTAYSYFTRQEKSFVLNLDINKKLQSAMGKFLSQRWAEMDSEEKVLYSQLYNADLKSQRGVSNL